MKMENKQNKNPLSRQGAGKLIGDADGMSG